MNPIDPINMFFISLQAATFFFMATALIVAANGKEDWRICAAISISTGVSFAGLINIVFMAVGGAIK